MIKRLAVLNFLSLLLAIAVNVLAQLGKINDQTIGEVSHRYPNLFTPADYTFSIWGLIYLSLLLFTGYMLTEAFSKERKKEVAFIRKTSFWFIITNIGNCLWVIAWLYEFSGMAVVLLFLMMMKLIKIILNTDMELYNAPFKVIAFYWWPICLYSGWVAVACITNVASFLSEYGWQGSGLTPPEWTIIMIAATVLLNILMIYLRNMREFAAVGIWALIGLYVRHSAENSENQMLARVAMAGAILIFLNAAYHGYKNRKTNPIYRLINGS